MLSFEREKGMAVFKSLINAISTYSKIPMPFIKMEEKESRFTMVFFPVVGFFIALIEYGWLYIADRFLFNNIAYVLIAALIPVFVTGGIHLDGFMDCMDAASSYKDKEKKLEILSDPHIGAFSVIRMISFSGLYVAAFFLVSHDYLPVVFFGFIVSRILSALSVILFESAKENGMVFYLKKNLSKSCVYILAVELLLVNLLLVAKMPGVCLLPVVFSWLSLLIYYKKSKKDFGGITGDTSGCFLCMTELLWVVAVAITSVFLSWI